jgi:hypothetical protein
MVKKKELTEEEVCEELDEKGIKELTKKWSKNPYLMKEKPVKEILFWGNKPIKCQMRAESIEKGVNCLLGYEGHCVECGIKKTIYNPYIRTTENYCKCFEYSKQGKMTFSKIDRKSINGTGLLVEFSDPLDNGASQSTYLAFFDLRMLSKKKIKLDELEENLLSEVLQITAIVRPRQGKGRSQDVTENWLDVTDFKVLKRDVKYNTKTIKKLNGIDRDDAFYEKYYCPSVYGKNLSKKVHSIVLCQPHKIKMPNDEIIFSAISVLEAGDPGCGKTFLAKEGFGKYTNAPLESATNTSKAGLTIGLERGKSGGYIPKIGILPRQHLSGMILDEYSKLSPEDISELRDIKEEGILNVNKCGVKIKKETYVNLICLGNLKNDVNYYNTKHKASYDLSVSKTEKAEKFNGADRRRERHVIITGNDDLSTQAVSRLLLMQKKDTSFDDYDFWSNVNKFAWNCTPEQIKWEDNIAEEILKAVNELNKIFGKYELEYSCLGKPASTAFTRQLPAIAILHGSLESENVMINKSHVKWLLDLYKEEYTEMGLYSEKEQTDFLNTHAEKIITHSPPEILEVLKLISIHGSSSAIEREGIMTRKTIYRRFQKVINYNVLENEDEHESVYAYSYLDGSVKQTTFNEQVNYESDGLIPSLSKPDGTHTGFGNLILRKIRENTKTEDKK